LAKSERVVDEQMLAMLGWASVHHDRWHNIGKLDATQKAAALLAKRGVIEICGRKQMTPVKTPPTTKKMMAIHHSKMIAIVKISEHSYLAE
jgi:hypothetical protein